MSATGDEVSMATGGAGLFGSHLCARLIASGRQVLRLDYFFTDSKAQHRARLVDPNFELMRHDIAFPRSAATAREKGR
jgi:UDP-glucuronate decarboxylase